MSISVILHNKRMNIHDKIRIIRQSKGYTQQFVADKLNIDTINYGRIERGQSKFTVDRLLDLCKILETSPAILFSETFDEKDNTQKILEQIHKEVKEINTKLKNENSQKF